jgi:hypothetical protein
MSWISSVVKMCRRMPAVAGALLGVLVTGQAVAQPVSTDDVVLVRLPVEFDSRAPALVDGVGRDFGQRPRAIVFSGRDTMILYFVKPAFWNRDMEAEHVPEESLPLARQAAEHLARYVWTTFGRDAGLDVVGIIFIRLQRVHGVLIPNQEVSAQQVEIHFNRQMLETGKGEFPIMMVTERRNWLQPESGRLCYIGPMATTLRCGTTIEMLLFGQDQ